MYVTRLLSHLQSSPESLSLPSDGPNSGFLVIQDKNSETKNRYVKDLPFDLPLSYKSSDAIVVGKWYCPFMFIKDGTLRDQMKKSMFYEMTLEQKWEQIFTCVNGYNQGNVVFVDFAVQTEIVTVGGREAVWDENRVADGVIWFRSFGVNIGLSSLIVDRMKWEQERGGWLGGEKRQVSVNKTEEYAGIGVGGWSRFGCYVLVERFVLKRMDRSVALTYDFKHTHVIRSKWE
ncbi:hypothetical protein ACSBR2_006250 [Camellia fascicularis]